MFASRRSSSTPALLLVSLQKGFFDNQIQDKDIHDKLLPKNHHSCSCIPQNKHP